ncbi:hypothetical protein GW17_00041964 [Ensete ventricosum]|nr:hypothetical protein GW17_00041964 [Ensete ventricosum]
MAGVFLVMAGAVRAMDRKDVDSTYMARLAKIATSEIITSKVTGGSGGTYRSARLPYRYHIGTEIILVPPVRTDYSPRIAISICTARTGWYVPVCQVTVTWIARYWAVLPKSIVGGRLREKKGRKKKKERKEERRRRGEEERSTFAPSSPARCRCPWVARKPLLPSPAGDFSPVRVDGTSPYAGRKIEATSLRRYPYRPIHTGPAADRYTDRPLPGGTAKIGRRRSISAVDGRFPPSIVDFSRLRSIEEEKGKNKKRKRRRRRRGEVPRVALAALCPGVAHESSSPAPPAGDFSPHAGRRNVSPRGRELRRLTYRSVPLGMGSMY